MKTILKGCFIVVFALGLLTSGLGLDITGETKTNPTSISVETIRGGVLNSDT